MNPELPYLVRAVSASSSDAEAISIPYELEEIVRLAWRHFNEDSGVMNAHVYSVYSNCLRTTISYMKRAYEDTVRDLHTDLRYEQMVERNTLSANEDSSSYKELEAIRRSLVDGYKQAKRNPIYKQVEASKWEDCKDFVRNNHGDAEDPDELMWWAFYQDVFDGDENADAAAAMLMLLSDAFLEESIQSSPRVDKLVTIFARIKDVETALYCVKKIRPDDGLVSLPKTVVERARQAGSTKSWHKKPLQDVISKLEPGLKWGQVFRRLSEMGDDVPHPVVKSIECANDRLIITPSSGKHKPRRITYRTLTGYKKP